MNICKKLFLMFFLLFQLTTTCSAMMQVGKMLITKKPKMTMNFKEKNIKGDVIYIEQDQKSSQIIYLLIKYEKCYKDDHPTFKTYKLNLSNSHVEKLYESLSLYDHPPNPQVYENPDSRIHYNLLKTYKDNMLKATMIRKRLLQHPIAPVTIELKVNRWRKDAPQNELTLGYCENYYFWNPKLTKKIPFKLHLDHGVYTGKNNISLLWIPPHFIIFIHPYLFVFEADAYQGDIVYSEQSQENPEIEYILTKIEKPYFHWGIQKTLRIYHTYATKRLKPQFNLLHASDIFDRMDHDACGPFFQETPESRIHYRLLDKYRKTQKNF